jgi:xanthosine utilization system XapX-like protein
MKEEDQKKATESNCIIGQVLLGCMAGTAYMLSYNDTASSLFKSMLDFFLWINAIFYGTIVVSGCISARVLKRGNRLVQALGLSLLLGVLFNFLYGAIAEAIPPPVGVFLPLVGYIVGFNLVLLHQKNDGNSETANNLPNQRAT